MNSNDSWWNLGHDFSSRTMLLKRKELRVCDRWSLRKHIGITQDFDSTLNSVFPEIPHVFTQSDTTLYLGREGFSLNNPFKSLLITGYLPNVKPFISGKNVKKLYSLKNNYSDIANNNLLKNQQLYLWFHSKDLFDAYDNI